MNTHRDPRDRRAHRLAAVAGGLSPAMAAAEADPDAVHALPEDLAEAKAAGNLLDGAVRLELGIDAWRAEARTADPEPAEDLGPAMPTCDATDHDHTGSSCRGPLLTANLPAVDVSSGAPAAELAANLPAPGPLVVPVVGQLVSTHQTVRCTCTPLLCLDEDCAACAGLDPELPCPIADGDGEQGQDDEAAGAAVPEPGPAPAAQDSSVPTHGGRALAWASRHDPKSLEYLVRDRLAHRVAVQDRAWDHGPILDQGTVPPLSLHDGSSCTGNMAVNLRNILEAATVPASTRPEDIDWLGEDDARTIYEHAQDLDEWPGHAYPGTSVLAMMKAGQAAGWWDSYLWCTSTRDIAQALLQVGPVGIGVPLTEGMAAPGPDGIVAASGRQLGGHAMAVFALRQTVAGRPGPWFGLLQSYGPKVGDGGQLWIHHTDLARLLPGTGEAAVPIVAGMLA